VLNKFARHWADLDDAPQAEPATEHQCARPASAGIERFIDRPVVRTLSVANALRTSALAGVAAVVVELMLRQQPRPDGVNSKGAATLAPLLIGYARVSTDQQDLSAQRAALSLPGVSSDRIYVDRGLSGTNRQGPGLRERSQRAAPATRSSSQSRIASRGRCLTPTTSSRTSHAAK
jgi:hypothetical protein